jgi:hypothetical protein
MPGESRKKMLEGVFFGVKRLPLHRRRCFLEALPSDSPFKEALLLELINTHRALPHSAPSLGAALALALDPATYVNHVVLLTLT